MSVTNPDGNSSPEEVYASPWDMAGITLLSPKGRAWLLWVIMS